MRRTGSEAGRAAREHRRDQAGEEWVNRERRNWWAFPFDFPFDCLGFRDLVFFFSFFPCKNFRVEQRKREVGIEREEKTE
jgi:hypothetical protein